MFYFDGKTWLCFECHWKDSEEEYGEVMTQEQAVSQNNTEVKCPSCGITWVDTLNVSILDDRCEVCMEEIVGDFLPKKKVNTC